MRVGLGTVAAMATAAVAVASLAYAQGRRSPSRVRNPLTSVPEPAGGYAARWQRDRSKAISRCCADPQVTTLPQAVACALRVAFPESRQAPQVGWLAEAARLIERDLLTAASRDGRPARAWELCLWLQGRTALQQCGGRVRCAAQRIFPAADWQSPGAAWQWQLLAELDRLRGEA